MQSNYGPSVLRGVFAHIAAHGEWGLEIIRSVADFTTQTIEEAVTHKADGCIIALNEERPEAYQTLINCSIPFVTVETFSDILASRKHNARHIRIDNQAIGRDAARNFLKQGRYMSFGVGDGTLSKTLIYGVMQLMAIFGTVQYIKAWKRGRDAK